MGGCEYFIVCLLATILHEYAHYLTAEKLGMQIGTAQITPFGGMIEIPLHKYPTRACVAVIFAGGLANLCIAVLLSAVWWFYPASYAFTYSFAKANIVIALVNFLPCYPLDGGRAGYIWCKEVLKIRNCERVISILGMIVGIAFLAMFIIQKSNPTLATLGVFMILGSEKSLKITSQFSAIEKWQSCEFENRKISEQQTLVASAETEVYKVFFHFKKGGENVVKVKFPNGKTTQITQGELREKIMQFGSEINFQTKLSEILH